VRLRPGRSEPAKRASTMALDEVRRLHPAYRGPEHYLTRVGQVVEDH
jgi:hypothetical protein